MEFIFRAVFAFSLAASASYGVEQQLPLASVKNSLRPFQSDICTRWFDKFSGHDYAPCCLVHDVKYWVGGSQKEKLAADKELRSCISELSGPFMGFLVYAGVRLWGKLDPHDITRWGYGWTYKRSSKETLNDEERVMAAKLTPENLYSALVKYWSPTTLAETKIETYQAEPFPSLTQNYCLDEVASAIVKSEVNPVEDLKLEYWPHPTLQNAYRIRTNVCKGEIFAMFRVPNLKVCTEPHYSSEPSNFLDTLHGDQGCAAVHKALKRINSQRSK